MEVAGDIEGVDVDMFRRRRDNLTVVENVSVKPLRKRDFHIESNMNREKTNNSQDSLPSLYTLQGHVRLGETRHNIIPSSRLCLQSLVIYVQVMPPKSSHNAEPTDYASKV